MENNILRSSDYKIIIILVGLPARGKSFTSSRLCNYLNWCGLSCKVFNAGDYRRNILKSFQDNSFFDNNNQICKNKREEISRICFQDLLKWISLEGDIGIFDATNTTKDRRKYLITEMLKSPTKIKSVFLELITHDNDIIKTNLKLKMRSPDYLNQDQSYALQDFKKRLSLYEDIYQVIDDNEDISYIKKYNLNNKICIRNISGICESLIISFLTNLRIVNYPIYISRHGESIFNTEKRLGGDSSLTEKGKLYSKNLGNFINTELKDQDFLVFTSCLKRTIQTSDGIYSDCKKIRSRILNEIDAGICENMTEDEMKDKYSHILEQRNINKLQYRYPEGESYIDLLERLRYFILQILSVEKPIVIIAHRAINRILLGYFLGITIDNIPHIQSNLNELVKLVPTSKGYTKEIINL